MPKNATDEKTGVKYQPSIPNTFGVKNFPTLMEKV